MPRPRRNDPKRHATAVQEALHRLYPDADCALRHDSPFQLLVATILSAQCTDACVNRVTPALFARYPDARTLAEAPQEDVETLIHPTGFFRSKAKNLIAMARILVDRHGGAVPVDLDALTKLPGVGRKTANVVLGTAFGIPSGVVVDTHVKRLSYRLGLTNSTQPEAIERDLMKVLPPETWIALSHQLIRHGRTTCLARRPRCESCGLRSLCPRRGVESTQSG